MDGKRRLNQRSLRQREYKADDILTRCKSIHSSILSRFLADRKWAMLNHLPGVAAQWCAPNGVTWASDPEELLGVVFVPLDPRLPDYPNRVLEALRMIAKTEKVSLDQVFLWLQQQKI